MDPIETRFRTVEPEIIDQIDQILTDLRSLKEVTIKKIKRSRALATQVIKHRARRIKEQLKSETVRSLAERAQTLSLLHTQSQTITLSVLKMSLIEIPELSAQTILKRLDLIFDLLGKQQESLLLLNPRDSMDNKIKDLCFRKSITLTDDPGCSPGDFTLAMSSGKIHSSLEEDLTQLMTQFTQELIMHDPLDDQPETRHAP